MSKLKTRLKKENKVSFFFFRNLEVLGIMLVATVLSECDDLVLIKYYSLTANG